MQQLFGSAAIDVGTWFKIILISSSVFILVEVEKMISYRLHHGSLKTDSESKSQSVFLIFFWSWQWAYVYVVFWS